MLYRLTVKRVVLTNTSQHRLVSRTPKRCLFVGCCRGIWVNLGNQRPTKTSRKLCKFFSSSFGHWTCQSQESFKYQTFFGEELAEPFSWIEQSALPVVRGSRVSNSRFSIAARIYQKGCFHVFQQRNRHSPDADACLMCVHCITLHPGRKWCICMSRSDACVFADMCIDGKGSSPSLGRGKQHDRILFKGRTRLLLLLLEWTGCAKYAALCKACSTMRSMQLLFRLYDHV